VPEPIAPHGGTLVSRLADDARARELHAEAASLPRLALSSKQSCDLEMIATGAFSPLTTFMDEADFCRVIETMTLTRGDVWPLPIVLAADEDAARAGDRIGLYRRDSKGADVLQAVMSVASVFRHDREKAAAAFFNRPEDDDGNHPGAEAVRQEGPVCLTGPLEAVTACVDPEGPEAFMEYRLTPAQTRAAFRARGWNSVTAFQTRNPIHRAHEYLCKCAQEITDGLLIHPLVGETGPGDIPAATRMKCYEVLVGRYFNSAHTLLSVMPAAMRYAGPREAILHAIVRKNYGATHFIVGRDHAGTGAYYGTYDAHAIFDTVDRDNLAIEPFRFEHAAWSRAAGGMVSNKTFPQIDGDRVFLSGTKVREMLRNGEPLPAEFTRPEVAAVLRQWMRTR